jgi:hypothetical protein
METRTETVNFRGVKLTIATPTEGPKALYQGSLMETTQHLSRVGIPWRYIPEVGDSLVQRARNVLVAKAMEDDAMTHFLFIDSDLGWEPQVVTDLVGGMLLGGHDLACVVYPKKCLPIDWPANFINNAGLVYQHPLSGFMELADAPTGFMCATRQCLLRMMNAYPERKCTFGPHQPESQRRWSYDLFSAIIDVGSEDRRFLSEDFGFCRMWQHIGGRIWAHATADLSHEGPYRFSGKLIDVLKQVPPPTE